MVTKSTIACVTTTLVVLLVLFVDTSNGQSSYVGGYNSQYQAAPRFFGGWGQSRSFWSRARSIMPRLTDVASEAAAVLVVPALAVLALSAVWPHRQHYRSKRQADQVSEAPINELSEHMMNIYMAAMESDECLQRIACEVGAVSKSFKSDNFNTVMTVLGSTTSSKYSKLFEKFKYGMNSEKCEMIGCALLDQ